MLVFSLLVRIRILRKSVQEITRAFQEIVSTETNTLIGISSRDLYLRKLAACMNDQLRILRAERLLSAIWHPA